MIKKKVKNLRRSMNFVLGDLSRIRTEVFKTSPLYRQNLTKIPEKIESPRFRSPKHDQSMLIILKLVNNVKECVEI